MGTDLRIYQHHRLVFDRGDEVRITVDGEPVRAFTKEPVAVALFAAGKNVLARSLKFHRPRGAFCLAGNCQSCRMTVDGVPGVRTCRTYPRNGMEVRAESGFPKVTNDLLFAADFVFPRGLSYQTMLTRPGFANRLLVKAVRRLASSSGLPPEPPEKATLVERECDVAVIGAGPAGVSAALGAAGSGRSILLIDEEPEVGGRLRYECEDLDLPGGGGMAPGYEYAKNYPALLEKAGVEFLGGALAAGRYADGVLAVARGSTMLALRPKRAIVCTGAMEQNAPFPGNDLPNVLSARGLRRLTNLHGLCPAVQAFVIGTDPDALSLALRLPEIGVRVVGMLEPGEKIAGPRELANEVQRRGVPLFLHYRVRRALGRFHLTGIEIEPDAGGERVKLKCDLIAVSARPAPAFHLLGQFGCELKFDPAKGGFVTKTDGEGRTEAEGVYVAGEVTGETDAARIVMAGRLAGEAAAKDLGEETKR